jgi:hypothetical protein
LGIPGSEQYMKVGIEIVTTLLYVQRIVKGKLNALFAGGDINDNILTN